MSKVRLANHFVPTLYDLHVDVNLEEWTYTAKETINLASCEDSTVSGDEKFIVTLHAGLNMKIASVTGATIAVPFDAKSETIKFKLDGIPSSTAAITVEYANEISEELKGFYRSTFTVDGVTQRIASTHFEPVGARRFYICQDEPAARASFRLSVGLPAANKDLVVLSNAPTKSVTHREDGSIVHQFDDIDKCPPYLTALAIGSFECIEETVNSIPVRFFTTKGTGKINKAKFGLEAACFSLDFFEKFFQSKFPLPKLDLIAIPDYPIGGMENWGLITLIENVLVEEGVSNLAALKGASNLMCHEVSHNWFGNLVGIDWWEGLWLKEGFASWGGYYATMQLRPQWKIEDDLADEIFHALGVDGRLATHPIEAPIQDPADITQVFDSISYSKGMAVVTMLKQYLGDEGFSAGLAHYVNQYEFRNTKTNQLWKSLEESSGKPIAKVMDGFTTLSGHPTVSIEFSEDKKSVTLSQKRYAIAINKVDSTMWTIPVIFANNNSETFSVMLEQESQSFTFPDGWEKVAWIKANAGHTGFFRCLYKTPGAFANLVHHIQEMSPIDQCGFQNDAFALFNADELAVEDILAMLQAYGKQVRNNSVLSSYLEGVDKLISCLDVDGDEVGSKEIAKSFYRLGAAQVIPMANDVFCPEHNGDATPKAKDTFTTTEIALMRRELVSRAIGQAKAMYDGNVSEVLTQNPIVQLAKQKGDDYLFHNGALDADAMPACLKASISLCDQYNKEDGSGGAFHALWKKFLELDGDAVLTRIYISALCSSPSEHHFEFMVKEMFSNENIRSMFGGTLFMAVSANAKHSKKVWPMFQTNFADIDRLWGGGQFRIQAIVGFVGSTIPGGEAKAKEFENFFVTHPLPNAKQAIERAVEGIKLRGFLSVKYASVVKTAVSKLI